MKTKTAIAVIFIATNFSSLRAAEESIPDFPPAASQLIKDGVKLDMDFKKFLIAASTWTWEHKDANNESITFQANGEARQSGWIGKWFVTGSRKVTIKIPNLGTCKLEFSEDLKTYTGAWNKTNPLHGKFIK